MNGQRGRAGAERRTRVILLLADGCRYAAIAAMTGCSSRTIALWKQRHAGLQPHRLERYMRSTDPDFGTKAADVIGLYLDPPQHAVVFCIDEKTAIQALDRLDPVLPLSPGRAERHGFEYYRPDTHRRPQRPRAQPRTAPASRWRRSSR